MKRYTLDELAEGGFFSAPVFLDKSYILLSPDTPVTARLMERLQKWGYTEVFSEGEKCDNPLFANSADEESTDGVEAAAETGLSEEDAAYENYRSLIAFTGGVMKAYADASEVDIEALTAKIRDVIESMRESRDLLLACIMRSESSDNYLVVHLANTTLLTLAMGDYMKLPPHRMIELGLCAILHEIGMTKIPKELYMSAERLSNQEKTTLMAHTVLGYRILKNLSVSEAVARGVLEHQERLDGSGYPNHLTGDAISLYARILGVACSYDAMISRRPYRDASSGHQAMLQLLKNDRKSYDERALKALIYCLSFYPLGSKVILNNRLGGVVYGTNPENPKFPLVKVLFDKEGEPLAEPRLVQTSQQANIVISRVLNTASSDA